MESFINKVKNKLQNPLPAQKAHHLMASQMRKNGTVKFPKRKNTRIAAVLILLYRKENQIHIPFILRPDYGKDVRTHSGQMALPGGGREQEDEDLIATALRETEEEIGVKVPRENILGGLSQLYIPPSDSMVNPYVAFIDKAPEKFVLDPKEVAQVYEAKLDDFFNPELRKMRVNNFQGQEWQVPYFDVVDKAIWGATAMMMSELTEILR
jgi:8-oxo-dGTP pyrophosphatase MutT (NUDIX family)